MILSNAAWGFSRGCAYRMYHNTTGLYHRLNSILLINQIEGRSIVIDAPRHRVSSQIVRRYFL